MKQLDRERKIVFGLSPSGQGDNIPLVALGIPKGAWEWMKDGRTHNFDLTKAGLPIKLMLYGAKNHAAALNMIEQHNQNVGVKTDVDLDKDFSIQPIEPDFKNLLRELVDAIMEVEAGREIDACYESDGPLAKALVALGDYPDTDDATDAIYGDEHGNF